MTRTFRHPKERITTEDPELVDRFDRVLGDTVLAMEAAGIRYAFIGGIASSGLGRPRSTHDIDIFVRPEDAEIALRALAKHGFRVERTDPTWLYKGLKENILVDIIFRSKGEIYFDQEMYQKMTVAEYHGKMLRLIGPEDLLIIKAVAHSELTPGHWHDAIGLLTHASLDWKYLIKRARRAPRRILSLLLYAQSNDIWVPNTAIRDLFNVIFESGAEGVEARKKAPELKEIPAPRAMPSVETAALPPVERHARPYSAFTRGKAVVAPARAPGFEYNLEHLRERLAEDLDTNQLDIQVALEGNRIVLRGAVTVDDRRRAAEEIARESFPGFAIDNQIQVVECQEPSGAEEVK